MATKCKSIFRFYQQFYHHLDFLPKLWGAILQRTKIVTYFVECH